LESKAKSGLDLTPNPDATRQMAPHRRENNLHGIEDYRWPFFSVRFWVWAVAGEEAVYRWARAVFVLFYVGSTQWFQLRSRTFLLTMELLEVGIVVGLVQFVFSVGRCSRARAPFQARHGLFAFPSSQQGRSFYQSARNHRVRVSGVCRAEQPDPGAP
jgi:hypothetical protein